MVDGAIGWQRFWNVTVPMCTRVILFRLSLMGIIIAFQDFTLPFVLTGGRPMKSTEFYVVDLYRNAFVQFDLGKRRQWPGSCSSSFDLLGDSLPHVGTHPVYYGGEIRPLPATNISFDSPVQDRCPFTFSFALQTSATIFDIAKYANPHLVGDYLDLPVVFNGLVGAEDDPQIYTVPPSLIPSPAYFDDFYDAWTRYDFDRAALILSSAIHCVRSYDVGLSVLVAYGFAKSRWPGR